jgi:hypothetical protein
MDIADLEHCLRIGTPLPEIASFLMRDEEEVSQKIEELVSTLWNGSGET